MTIPLIIDTDPGVDDMLALLLACGSPELDLRAVTTSYGNVSLATTTDNARRVLALAGRRDVPVAAGAERPLVYPQPGLAAEIHGEDGMGGLSRELPDPDSAASQSGNAVDLMAQVLSESATPVVIAVLGPCTNVALLLATHPELTDRIERIVVMGGAASGGNTSAVAEFNVWCDPEAAQRVFNDVVPVTMVGLDVTRNVPVDDRWLDDLASRGAVAAGAARITRSYNDYFRSLGRTSFLIHDAVAIAAIVADSVVTTTPGRVFVDCGFGPARGCTVVNWKAVDSKAASSRSNPVQVGVSADASAIRELIAERLGSLG